MTITNRSLTLSIAPDIQPEKLPGWHIFTLWLKKELGLSIKALDYESFQAQRDALARDEIDIIFANPFDTSILVREHGFIPIAQPLADAEEIAIVTRTDSMHHNIDTVRTGVKVAASDNPDLRQLGLILLEPANLQANDIEFITSKNHLLAIKSLLNHESELAFIPNATYKAFSNILKKNLKPLVVSLRADIDALSHVFLIAPRLAAYADQIRELLLGMMINESSYELLDDLKIAGWKRISSIHDIDFLIDLVDTLQIKAEP